MGEGFEPTVIAAAIADAACDEIADWAADALSALPRPLPAELRVNSKADIQPTYRS
jgi:hypothetical protein